MQWDDTKYAGFSEVEPWLKVNENKSFINVAESQKDADSILNFYKKLIKVRKEEALVKDGVYKDLLPKSQKLFAYERRGDKEILLVLANFTDKEIECRMINKYRDYDAVVLLNNYDSISTRLKPYQSVLYKLTKKANCINKID